MSDERNTTTNETTSGGQLFASEAEWRAQQEMTPGELATIKLSDRADSEKYNIPEGAMFYIDRNGDVQWNGPDRDEVNDKPDGWHLVEPGVWALNSDPKKIQNWNVPLRPPAPVAEFEGLDVPMPSIAKDLKAVNEILESSPKKDRKKYAKSAKSAAKKKVKKAPASAKKKSKKMVAKKSRTIKAKARSSVKARKAVRSR